MTGAGKPASIVWIAHVPRSSRLHAGDEDAVPARGIAAEDRPSAVQDSPGDDGLEEEVAGLGNGGEDAPSSE